jgi:peptide/nickel transport system substrate-binding protein
MYDPIIGVDKNNEFSPQHGLAYKWEESSDSLTWTLYIRERVRFHNGDPLTNEDVKYTIETDASQTNNTGSRSDFMAHIDRVETAPPNKVIVHLKKPWANFLCFNSPRCSGGDSVLPKKYIEEKGFEYFQRHPIGSGPYKFIEWKENNYIKLEAHESHWRVGTPKYKYLTFKLMPEEGTRVAALQSGAINITPISLANAMNLQNDGYPIQRKKDGIFVGFMWLEEWRPEFPTHKKKVRQALIYAINKDEIVKQILSGYGRVVGTAPAMFTWSIEYKPYPHSPYDPKLAKKLLAEAGYPKGFTMYIYSTVSKLPELKLINEAIAGYWGAIGLDVKVLEMAFPTWRAYFAQQREVAGPAAFAYSWPNRPVYSWRSAFHSKGMFSSKRDPELDKMIEVFEDQTTTERYIAHGQKLMDYVLENFYASAICTADEIFATSKDVPKWEMGKGVGSYRWEYIGSE